MTEVDLFGDTQPIRKGQTGYLEHLARLDYGGGLRFWCLASAPRPKHLPADTTDMVWLHASDDGRRWELVAIDIRDGQILTRPTGETT